MQVVEGKEQEYQNYVDINQPDKDDPIGYGTRVVTYGEEWAELMEERMEHGDTLASIAKEASRKADTDGITGFMYGCAAKALSYYWIHGEEFRQWYNLNTQLGNEGERANEEGTVLNPALLNISKNALEGGSLE